MKKINFILIIAVLMCVTACNNWLTEKRQTHVFSLLKKQILTYPEILDNKKGEDRIYLVIQDRDEKSDLDTVSSTDVKKLVNYLSPYKVEITIPFRDPKYKKTINYPCFKVTDWGLKRDWCYDEEVSYSLSLTQYRSSTEYRGKITVTVNCGVYEKKTDYERDLYKRTGEVHEYYYYELRDRDKQSYDYVEGEPTSRKSQKSELKGLNKALKIVKSISLNKSST